MFDFEDLVEEDDTGVVQGQRLKDAGAEQSPKDPPATKDAAGVQASPLKDAGVDQSTSLKDPPATKDDDEVALLEDEDELKQLEDKVMRLKAELAELKALPPPQHDADLVQELEKMWNSYPLGEVGQGLQPSSRLRSGPLVAIWRAYFEHTMPGGLKSAALLRFSQRTDTELMWTYPNLKCDWHQKLLETSLVIHPAAFQNIKMEVSDEQGRNIVTNGYFQYDTKFGFPQYPYRVQEQDVLFHDSIYAPNVTEAAAERTGGVGVDAKSLFNAARSRAASPLKIATLRSAYLASRSVGDVDNAHKMLAEDRADDYREVIQPYQKHHVDAHLEGKDHPPANKAKNGVLLPLYPRQMPLHQFQPNRMYRGAQYIAWWHGQAHGDKLEGSVPHSMITDLMPSLQSAQPNNPFQDRDFASIFMQCRGWLKPHAMAEVVLFSDENNLTQLFILLNAGANTHALSGFLKYDSSKGELYQHEVMLATQGVDFLVAFARGQGAAKASKAVLEAVDLKNAKQRE